MTPQSTLLASSGSLIALTNSITRFYGGQEMRPDMASGHVIRQSDGKILNGVRVIYKGKRFRFEMV